jgi:hypothetical protein
MRNALIESGESLSAPVDVGEAKAVGVGIPAGWNGTATSITFQVSADGVTWQNLYADAGTEVTATVAASRNVSLAAIAASLAPWRFLKIRSGTTASAVTQEGNVISQYSPAGNRYGIRYSELLAFVIGAM